MKNNFCFAAFVIVVLTFGIIIVGCVSGAKEVSVSEAPSIEGAPITPRLDELLHKYAAPRPSNDSGKITYYYYLDPLRFLEFKAEIDAGGEYTQSSSGHEDQDKEQGKSLARWVSRRNGEVLQLELFTEDDSGISYDYKKVSQVSGLKFDEIFCKYAGPYPERWDEGTAYVYYLDTLRFEEFKAELDMGDIYQQADNWIEENRDWSQGVAFARWIIRPDGRFELHLCNADNSGVGYNYEKVR